MSADVLLARLEGVKSTGPGRWIAKCPGHSDRSPSLSVRELADGRVLLHDFAGCPPGDVLAAVGMTINDLFPERIGHHIQPSRSRVPAADLLLLIADEVEVVGIAAGLLIENKTLSETDWQRLIKASHRISGAVMEIRR
jgi:hypothetical protein